MFPVVSQRRVAPSCAPENSDVYSGCAPVSQTHHPRLQRIQGPGTPRPVFPLKFNHPHIGDPFHEQVLKVVVASPTKCLGPWPRVPTLGPAGAAVHRVQHGWWVVLQACDDPGVSSAAQFITEGEQTDLSAKTPPCRYVIIVS